MSINKAWVDYPMVGKYYYHYKGGLYKVISLATHTETGEVLVIYKSKNFGTVYARPLSEWYKEIKEMPDIKRFKEVRYKL
jgi:hypothetical protein